MKRLSPGIALLAAIVVAGPVAANDSGFDTSQPAMAQPVMAGVTVDPIITVGDTLGSGYRYEAIPDGIAVATRGNGRVDLYVNHETGRVPFPYNTANPTATNGENDFDNSQVSRLVLNAQSGGVLSGKYVIDASNGYQRFCSNYLATEAEGFTRDILFTNEETPDYVRRATNSWPVAIGSPEEREAGVVVAYDVRTGTHQPIYGMGRHNHENSVPVPGYGYPVVLSGDDTFTSGPLSGICPAGSPAPAQSQVYSYVAESTDSAPRRRGRPVGVRVIDTPGYNDYYDFVPGSGTVGHRPLHQVPREIATGLKADGTEVKAADFGFPLPPTNGPGSATCARWPRGHRRPAVGARVLEPANNVFNFVRVEDIAYDKRPGWRHVAFVVDSGRGGTRRARHAESVDQRPRLEDRVRSERSHRGDIESGVRRG